MGKLNKQSSGVGKYLKYHKEKVTGGNLPNVIQQTKAKITCCFCGSPCVHIRGESEWVKCRKCGELHRK